MHAGNRSNSHPVLHPTEHGTERNHQIIMEFVELVPRLAARISQVGKVRAGVKPLGPHQFFPSDQSHPATLAIRLLRTPHSAIALAFWRPARLSGTPIAGRNALPIGTMAEQVLDADTLEAVFKE